MGSVCSVAGAAGLCADQRFDVLAGFRLVARELLHPNRLARRLSDTARGLAAMTSALLPVAGHACF